MDVQETLPMTGRKIPASGINLFQLIYILIREYEEKSGKKALNLSLGNPDTVPNAAILALQAECAKDPKFEHHTYGEDNNLDGFAEGMVELHGRIKVQDHPHLKALPTAGIKGASTMVTLACGLHLPDRKRRLTFTVASNLPAYDILGTWSETYLGANRVVWPLKTEDNMRLNLARLKNALAHNNLKAPNAIFVIRPGNPAAVGCTPDEWKELIAFCVEHRVRLINDAAYAGLCGDNHTPLAAVAKDFPDLEWLELYSVSKSFSDPGARLGALVGAKDFVDDYNMIKGNTDSGPVPYVMAAYGRYFADRKTAKKAMDDLRAMYAARLEYVIAKLKAAGLRQACDTDAGFFTLWKVPKKAFGRAIESSEAYNRLVISETGIVGVHFKGPDGDPLIRYAVCSDVLDPEFQKRFAEGLARVRPEY